MDAITNTEYSLNRIINWFNEQTILTPKSIMGNVNKETPLLLQVVGIEHKYIICNFIVYTNLPLFDFYSFKIEANKYRIANGNTQQLIHILKPIWDKAQKARNIYQFQLGLIESANDDIYNGHPIEFKTKHFIIDKNREKSEIFKPKDFEKDYPTGGKAYMNYDFFLYANQILDYFDQTLKDAMGKTTLNNSGMEHLNFTKRTIEFINADFKRQTSPINGKYYVSSTHNISADYPLFELMNFKNEISTHLVHAINPDNLKILLNPLQDLILENIQMYDDVIKPIWNCEYGSLDERSNSFNGIEIVQSPTGSTLINIDTSKEFKYSFDPHYIFYGLAKKEYHNEQFYKYSLELKEFLEPILKEKNSVLKLQKRSLLLKILVLIWDFLNKSIISTILGGFITAVIIDLFTGHHLYDALTLLFKK